MTALLSCDGCGQIVSERPDDDNPTAAWWCLSAAPEFAGGGLLGVIALDVPDDDPRIDVPPPDPDRHFCSIACVVSWASRR